MTWKRCAVLPQSIRWLPAGIEPLCGMFFCLFLFVLLMVQMELFRYHTSALYLEDALTASNLAAAVIDWEEYGISGAVVIADGEACYQRFAQALEANLSLDDCWESRNSEWITGRVKVEQFIIYNLTDGVDYCMERDSAGRWQYHLLTEDALYTPDGQQVEHTGIYSRVSLAVQGAWGITIPGYRGMLVDVVADKRKGEWNETAGN